MVVSTQQDCGAACTWLGKTVLWRRRNRRRRRRKRRKKRRMRTRRRRITKWEKNVRRGGAIEPTNEGQLQFMASSLSLSHFFLSHSLFLFLSHVSAYSHLILSSLLWSSHKRWRPTYMSHHCLSDNFFFLSFSLSFFFFLSLSLVPPHWLEIAWRVSRFGFGASKQ